LNLADLKSRLVQEGFSSDVYCIGGQLPPYEGLVLEKISGAWKIDHYERGLRRELAPFSSEDEACKRMHELLVRYYGA
jgi:hypothetical protein